jgi:hypothetical protein
MTVGIGFDHGQDIAMTTDGIPNLPEIVPESSKVDFSAGRAKDRHKQLQVNFQKSESDIKSCDFKNCKALKAGAGIWGLEAGMRRGMDVGGWGLAWGLGLGAKFLPAPSLQPPVPAFKSLH